MTEIPDDRMARRLDRERRARREAERIAETALTDLYDVIRLLETSHLVLDESTDLVFIATAEGRINYANLALLQFLGVEAVPAELQLLEMVSPSSRSYFVDRALPTLHEKGIWRGELSLVAASGSGLELPVSQVLIGHRNQAGDIDSISSVARDISEQVAQEQELTRLALHDPLTGLSNRRLFQDRMQITASRSERAGTPFAVVFIDVDDFKTMNDTLGHEAGDEILVAVAERLVGCVRASDTVSRFGGDEFCILFDSVDGEAHVIELANRITEVVGRPLIVAGMEVSVSLSVGVVVASGTETEPHALLRQADAAMYQAKHSGKRTARVFRSD